MVKKLKSTLFIILFMFSFTSFGQKSEELYMVNEIKQAYDKKSRNYNGKPGKNYFVNHADYDIKVKFDPETREIRAKEVITYTNNSPDSLRMMFFNLYQDIYKKGNMRDWDIGPTDIHNGVNIEKIIFNSQDIELKNSTYTNRSSIMYFKLPELIKPGEKSTIEIHWNFTLPKIVSIRMGTYGDKNYFVAYWYPKVAVYDDIKGWNTRGHSGNQEFYNDFGTYNVEISVPGKYNVWSTGVLQNSNEIFTKKYLDKIEKSKLTEDIVHIIKSEDREDGNILKRAKTHIWKFKSENSPDFAFAVSKTYLWDATSVQSGDRRISINAVYKAESGDFHEVAEISRNSVQYFSEEIPGIPFPYPQMTAFNGRGGMEFPGMINDGDASNRNGTLFVTSHEIGHSYFPFYTGFNEQKYAWMDEGLISFFPKFFVEKYTDQDDFNFFENNISSYNKSAGSFDDVPLMTASDNVGRYAYRFHAYTRSSVSFYLLYLYLGKEKFTEGLKLFTMRWKGKHPTPYEFFFTFNEAANEDLAWFWKPWFFEFGYADLSISNIENIDNSTVNVHIKNKTGFPVPIILEVTYKNGSSDKFVEKMDVWKNGKKDLTINIPNNEIKKLELNTLIIPDVFSDDNIKLF